MKTTVSLLVVLFFTSAHCIPAQIIPSPQRIDKGKGQFIYGDSLTLFYNSVALDEAHLMKNLFADEFAIELVLQDIHTLKDLGKSKAIILNAKNESPIDYRMAEESYTLSIQGQIITIDADMDIGLWHGIQTLRQLLWASNGTRQLNVQVIRDRPAFVHRGLMLDCCRHFMELDFILKYIDLLAFYKMNILHWHLTEDQGWRIEIEAFPKLTSVGSRRIESDNQEYAGHYTQTDIQRVVKYAADRHITVIPEIEMPGHSRAAIASYPYLSCTGEAITVATDWGVFKDIYCAGNDSVFDFLEKVLDEVCRLFPSPYIHIGGDEAPKFRWDHCSKCQRRMMKERLSSGAELQTWFINRVASYLEKKGKRIIGWDEILEGGIPSSATVQSWRGMEGGIHAAKEAHAVIMSPTSHCYFDYDLSSTDLTEVYQFEPIPKELSVTDRQWILGGECNLWTENAPQETVDQKVFPRILGITEVLWRHPEKRDYSHFFEEVERQLPMLRAMNVDFGYSQVPVELHFDSRSDTMYVELLPRPKSVTLKYRMGTMQDDLLIPFSTYFKPIKIGEPSQLQVQCEYQGKKYDRRLLWKLDPHMAYKKSLSLGYSPSPWYTGGSNTALVDGIMGSIDFRDGHWQAVQGKDMTMIIDLGKDTLIRSVSTQWYMYSNAWIFVPERVEIWGSKEGESWYHLNTAILNEDLQHAEQHIRTLEQQLENSVYRFIKVVAVNQGACPEWHDAAGEPSWLFCDEIIVH